MSTNNIDELRKIKTWAPKCATEFGIIENEIIYIDNSDNGIQCKLWLDGEWNFSELIADSAYIKNRRSLADITTIIDQADKLAALDEKVILLEKVETIFNESPDLTFECVQRLFKDELAKRDLEMQAKGIADAVNKTRVALNDNGQRWLCRVVDLGAYSEKLFKQAGDL
jgi:hypothetical protein